MSELTQDFKILPHNDRIKEIIELDARNVAINIQQEVVEKIEANKGIVTVYKVVSDLYRDLVIKILQQWVKIHGYKLNIDGNNFTIYSPARKFKSSVVCRECGRQIKKSKHWFIKYGGLFGIIATVVSSNLMLYWNAIGATYVGSVIIVNGVFAVVGSIALLWPRINN